MLLKNLKKINYKIIEKKPFCFITKEFEDRIDCNFNNPHFFKDMELLYKLKYEKKDIGDVAYITDGEHGSPNYVDDGIAFEESASGRLLLSLFLSLSSSLSLLSGLLVVAAVGGDDDDGGTRSFSSCPK